MKIVFVLPRPYPYPVGGYKIVYDYADHLAENHEVTIYHVVNLPYSRSKKPSILKYIYFRLSGSIHFGWYTFRNPLRLKLCYDLPRIEACDCLIATAWSTAYVVQGVNAKKKFYLIQGYEIWGGEDAEKVFNSYHFDGITNITVSTFLKEKVEEYGGHRCIVAYNGIDLQKFHVTQPQNERTPKTVLMMYNRQFEKGAQDGITALSLVRAENPDIEVTFFGVEPAPQSIPSWIRYVCNPSPDELVELYNQHSIFINASHTEGFGLTIAEAMACGCAVATTDSGGCRDFAIHNQTALLSPVQDPEQLAENIMILLKSRTYREKLAKVAWKKIQNFSIENARRYFADCILRGDYGREQSGEKENR